MQNAAASLEQDSSSSDAVAKIVLKAVTSESPSLMYLAGKDVETWIDASFFMFDYS